MLLSHWDIYEVLIVAYHYLGSFWPAEKKWSLFWRFHAEMLISHWDIYVFVSFCNYFGSNVNIFLCFYKTAWTSFNWLRKMSPVLKVSCSMTTYHYWTHFDQLGKMSSDTETLSPVLKTSFIDIPLRYLCFCKIVQS